MNEIMNNVLLVGDKLIPEMHLRQPRFTYSACVPFNKNNERIEKFRETGDSSYIYQNERDKACFQHDIAFEDFKDLTRWTDSDKVLSDKAFNNAINPKCDGYQQGLASAVYKLFNEKTSGSGFIQNQELAKQLLEIIRKLEKRKIYASFKDIIWWANLADMQVISEIKNGFQFLLCYWHS